MLTITVTVEAALAFMLICAGVSILMLGAAGTASMLKDVLEEERE